MLADVKQMAASAAADGQAILSFEEQLCPTDRYTVCFLELGDPIITKTVVESSPQIGEARSDDVEEKDEDDKGLVFFDERAEESTNVDVEVKGGDVTQKKGEDLFKCLKKVPNANGGGNGEGVQQLLLSSRSIGFPLIVINHVLQNGVIEQNSLVNNCSNRSAVSSSCKLFDTMCITLVGYWRRMMFRYFKHGFAVAFCELCGVDESDHWDSWRVLRKMISTWEFSPWDDIPCINVIMCFGHVNALLLGRYIHGTVIEVKSSAIETVQSNVSCRDTDFGCLIGEDANMVLVAGTKDMVQTKPAPRQGEVFAKASDTLLVEINGKETEYSGNSKTLASILLNVAMHYFDTMPRHDMLCGNKMVAVYKLRSGLLCWFFPGLGLGRTNPRV